MGHSVLYSCHCDSFLQLWSLSGILLGPLRLAWIISSRTNVIASEIQRNSSRSIRFVHSGVQHILCCVFDLFVCVLCIACCQFLWIVNLDCPFGIPITVMCYEQLKYRQIVDISTNISKTNNYISFQSSKTKIPRHYYDGNSSSSPNNMARFNRLIGPQFILLDNSMQIIKKTSLHRFASIKKKTIHYDITKWQHKHG